LLRETQRLNQEIQDDADACIVEQGRRQQLFQARAMETHVLAREQQQQQQAKLAEEDAEENADMVSSSIMEPNP